MRTGHKVYVHITEGVTVTQRAYGVCSQLVLSGYEYLKRGQRRVLIMSTPCQRIQETKERQWGLRGGLEGSEERGGWIRRNCTDLASVTHASQRGGT